jgi:hypothetical protein
MKNGITSLALAGTLALLAGCGGGGDSEVATFTQMEADARAAAQGYIDPDTGALLAAERTSLPNSGTASYDGYVGGEVDGAGLIGELSLDVAFAVGDNGTITGSATNFQHETQGAYTGTLTVNNGNILPGGAPGTADTVAADLQGTLSNGGDDYATDIALDGAFLGGTGPDTPAAVAGGAVGNVGGGLFDGIFIVVQP